MKVICFFKLWLGSPARANLLFVVCALFGFLMHFDAAEVNAQGSVRTPAACKNKNGLNNDEIVGILQTHNVVRAGLKLAPLTWDCTLADLAQEWARRGVTMHRDDTFYGESIFVAGDPNVIAVSAVTRWMLEKPNWNNETGACTAGKTCTHYTQIVWKRTAKIGCGINRNLTGKWRTMLVCNYDPAGNDPGPAY